MTVRAERPLAILGPTASGKSGLAMAIAAEVEGSELVSVDSMQVYRGMNVGTATPTPEEQARVPHHLIDLVEPSENFAAGEFQARARVALAQIRGRGGTPILVGGTGLYLRAVIDDLEIPGRFPDVLSELEQEVDKEADEEANTRALYRRLSDLDPLAASRMEPTNRRRILRALEVTIGSGRPFSSFGPGLETYPPSPFVQVAIHWPRDVLHQRIAARYERQMADGFMAEVEALASHAPGRTAAQALGYRELLEHVEGQCTLDEALASAIQRTCRFASRQLRWFRRDPRIRWVEGPAEAAEAMVIWDDVCRTPAG